MSDDHKEDHKEDRGAFPLRRRGDKLKGVAALVGASSGAGGIGVLMWIASHMGAMEAKQDIIYELLISQHQQKETRNR